MALRCSCVLRCANQMMTSGWAHKSEAGEKYVFHKCRHSICSSILVLLSLNIFLLLSKEKVANFSEFNPKFRLLSVLCIRISASCITETIQTSLQCSFNFGLHFTHCHQTAYKMMKISAAESDILTVFLYLRDLVLFTGGGVVRRGQWVSGWHPKLVLRVVSAPVCGPVLQT